MHYKYNNPITKIEAELARTIAVLNNNRDIEAKVSQKIKRETKLIRYVVIFLVATITISIIMFTAMYIYFATYLLPMFLRMLYTGGII